MSYSLFPKYYVAYCIPSVTLTWKKITWIEVFTCSVKCEFNIIYTENMNRLTTNFSFLNNDNLFISYFFKSLKGGDHRDPMVFSNVPRKHSIISQCLLRTFYEPGSLPIRSHSCLPSQCGHSSAEYHSSTVVISIEHGQHFD